MKKLTAIVMGYGMRGQGYSQYSFDNPDELQIVGVAEPEITKKKLCKRTSQHTGQYGF